MKNTMKNKKEEKLQKRYFVFDRIEKMDPVLMSDRSFYSEAYGSFAKACDKNDFIL